MQTVTMQFAVTASNGVITRIGSAYMPHPKPGCDGDKIKWFEDRKLVRQQGAADDRTAILHL